MHHRLLKSSLAASLALACMTQASAEPSLAEQVATRVHGTMDLRLASAVAIVSTDAYKKLACALGKDDMSKRMQEPLEAALKVESPGWLALVAKEYESSFSQDELELLTVRSKLRPYLYDKFVNTKRLIPLKLKAELSERAGSVASSTLVAVAQGSDPATLQVDTNACKP